MKQLFYEGGPLFMGILTGILIIMVAWAIFHFLPVLLKKEISENKTANRLKHIKTFGLFGLIFGILGQLIGLFAAFDAIEKAGGVSQSLLMGGLKVSMIPTCYGIIIYLISLILWFVFDYIFINKIN